MLQFFFKNRLEVQDLYFSEFVVTKEIAAFQSQPMKTPIRIATFVFKKCILWARMWWTLVRLPFVWTNQDWSHQVWMFDESLEQFHHQDARLLVDLGTTSFFFIFWSTSIWSQPINFLFRDMWIFHQLFISIVAAKQKESKPVGNGTDLARKTWKRLWEDTVDRS